MKFCDIWDKIDREHVVTYSVTFGLSANVGHVCTLLDYIDREKM